MYSSTIRIPFDWLAQSLGNFAIYRKWSLKMQIKRARRASKSGFRAAVLAAAVASPASAGILLNTLASFNGTNGATPVSGVIIDASGNLYGTTSDGGTGGQGTVFQIPSGGGSVNTLASFNGTNGEYPSADLMAYYGDLYGTTQAGGSTGHNGGTIFSIPESGGSLNTSAAFTFNFAGAPTSGLTPATSGASNVFYGTTYEGGTSNHGTVFYINTYVGYSVDASFNGTNGSGPLGDLTSDASGNLYGVTYGGGAYSYGTVFKLAYGATTVTSLASFNAANGDDPETNLTPDAAGNLYGTTTAGGAYGVGTIFEISEATGVITTLASFRGDNGSHGIGNLVRDSSGDLFGTTSGGGTSDDGTVFELAAGSGTITTLVNFTGTANGSDPHSGLVADAVGNLYGTTSLGGANNDGTVFEVTGIPEPASLSLLSMGSLTMLRRRRSGRDTSFMTDRNVLVTDAVG